MNISLREWKSSDLDSLLFHANNPNIAGNMTNAFPHPYTQKDGEAFLSRVTNMRSGLILAIDADGEAVGSVGIFPQEDIECKNAEMGYWLSEQYWNKGIISKVIPMMLKTAFSKFEIDRIYARPFGNNLASQRVLEKNGFTLEAIIKNGFFKNGAYTDAMIYGIRREEAIK